MPLNLPKNLPAIQLLRNEHIFVMDEVQAKKQDIRPLHVAILNLMPLKIKTETDLTRLLSNSPLQLTIDFVKIKEHYSKNTPPEHLEQFYKDFQDIKQQYYDGLIVTGAPIELLPFEHVTYWEEIKQIFDWAKTNVTSSIYICWAAQAALYHFYGIPKYQRDNKMFGVFKHNVTLPTLPIFRGFDDQFLVPHSRHTEIKRNDILNVTQVTLLSESKEAGVYMAMARGGREFFVTGHAEYGRLTLHDEYVRDIKKGININIPANYYPNDDTTQTPVMNWKAHANMLYVNWLNYYVYQETPYNIQDIQKLGNLGNNKR